MSELPGQHEGEDPQGAHRPPGVAAGGGGVCGPAGPASAGGGVGVCGAGPEEEAGDRGGGGRGG